MLDCSFVLDRRYFCKLNLDTLRVDAFSGNGPDRNNPDSTAVPNVGPLPIGTYYVVDRESGGRFGKLYDLFSNKEEWFALYRNDGMIDDQTFVNSVVRGNFRLHPRGPLGLSRGCVTVEHQDDFDRVRRKLLKAGRSRVRQNDIMAYAVLTVGSVLDPLHRSRQQETRFA